MVNYQRILTSILEEKEIEEINYKDLIKNLDATVFFEKEGSVYNHSTYQKSVYGGITKELKQVIAYLDINFFLRLPPLLRSGN